MLGSFAIVGSQGGGSGREKCFNLLDDWPRNCAHLLRGGPGIGQETAAGLAKYELRTSNDILATKIPFILKLKEPANSAASGHGM